jgi:phage gpG-like protein
MLVTTKADFSNVLAGLAAMQRGRSPHHELKQLVDADQRDHAKKRSGPEGAWAPRAPSTVRKMRLDGVRRRPLGKLVQRGAVSYRATKTGVIGTSKIKWSGVHQDGGRVGRGSVLKARPFLWLSKSLLVTSERLLTNVYVRRFGGR